MRTFASRCAVALLLVALAPPPAAGARVEICYSADQPSTSATPPSNATVFSCPLSGAQTLPQLAAAGLRVVSLKPVTGASFTMIRQQLTVQRRVEIHGDGFE